MLLTRIGSPNSPGTPDPPGPCPQLPDAQLEEVRRAPPFLGLPLGLIALHTTQQLAKWGCFPDWLFKVPVQNKHFSFPGISSPASLQMCDVLQTPW